MKTIKCVVVGDENVGKTCLINNLINFRSESTQKTLVDNYGAVLTFKNLEIQMSIWDVGGDASNKTLRILSYNQVDVFVVCYAVNNLESFENVPFWLCEIKDHCVPIVLCGTKCDEEIEIPERLVMSLCKNYGVAKHLYCSAKHQINVRRVFEKALHLYIKEKNVSGRKKCFCC